MYLRKTPLFDMFDPVLLPDSFRKNLMQSGVTNMNDFYPSGAWGIYFFKRFGWKNG